VLEEWDRARGLDGTLPRRALSHLLAETAGRRLHNCSSLWRCLHRLGIHYKRGRSYRPPL